MPAKNFELDLLIAGNATTDTVFYPDKAPQIKFGGIYNLQEISFFPLKVEYQPFEFGSADIFIDRWNPYSPKQVVRVSLNDGHRTPDWKSAKWTHIAYANALRFYPFEKTGIVSVDLCAGKSFQSPYLKMADYVFVSDDEFDPYKINTKATIIAHSPTQVRIIANGKVIYDQQLSYITCVNPLGAGDMFAGRFIENKLNGSDDIFAVKYAVELTQQWLVSRSD